MAESGTGWLIAAAVDMEIQGLRQRLKHLSQEQVPHGKLWNGLMEEKPLSLARTGVGPKRAVRTVTSLISSRKFKGILSIGFAGALRHEYEVGDLVIPGEIQSIPPLAGKKAFPDPKLFQEACRTATLNGCSFHTDRMITSHRVISTGKEKNQLGERHEAGSVEMESSALAELAEEASLPFLVVRVISDGVSFNMPDTMELLGCWQRREWGGLIRHTLGNPAQTADLIKLGRQARKASKILTRFLAILIPRLTNAGDSSGSSSLGGQLPNPD